MISELPLELEHYSHFSSVFRLEFFHDVADMHLHGTFTHIEFVSYDLVRLATAECPHHRSLSCGEHFELRNSRLAFADRLMVGGNQAAGWNEDTCFCNQSQRLNRDR